MKGHTVGFLGPQIYILRQPFVLEAQTKTLEAGWIFPVQEKEHPIWITC